MRAAAARFLLVSGVLVVVVLTGGPYAGSVPSRTQAGGGAAEALDVLLINGRVHDGTGGPWMAVAVGIRGDRIGYLGPAATSPPASEVIDVAGAAVAPGFIDVHTHAQGLREPDRSLARNWLHQGVTTVVTGNDGGGPVAIAEALAALERAEPAVNVGLLVGHGSVRRRVMGSEDRRPTADELARMQMWVARAMVEGALGLSTGLFYAPGSFADTDEVVALAAVAAEYGGIYDSHLRDEDSYTVGLLAAVDEAIRIGREARIPVHISHVKALGPESWGLAGGIVERVEMARREGVEVTADQYPYVASSTSVSGALIPRWAQSGGEEALSRRLADPDARQRILEGVRENLRRRGGPETLVVAAAPDSADLGSVQVDGKDLAELARRWEMEPAEAALALQQAGGAGLVSFNMSQEDLDLLRRQPWVMTASDGALVRFGSGVPHPRSYGTFPRVLGRLVRERRLLTLAQAIRAATSLPARTFRLWDRGVLRAGGAADVVVFDPAGIADRATFEAPHAYAEGVLHLWVNGVATVRDGRVTGARGGRALHGSARPGP